MATVEGGARFDGLAASIKGEWGEFAEDSGVSAAGVKSKKRKK